MTAETYRFTVGSFECIAVLDCAVTYTAAQYVANAPADQVAAALRAHQVDPERIPSPYSGLVVNTGAHLVLIDTGAGDYRPGLGQLRRHLLARGIAPEEIDVVVITHAHPDHLGGATDEAGQVVFRTARHVLLRPEWDYWMGDPDRVSPINQRMLDFARRKLAPVAGQVDLLDGAGEIVPGLAAIPAPGHTPGQMAVAVTSGRDELLYISDAAIHPIHLEQPDWYPPYDVDPAQALASKRLLFDRAADERALVLAFHFDPFPSLGHVVRAGRGWQWQPVAVKAI